MEFTNSTNTGRLVIVEAFAFKGFRMLPFSQMDTTFSLVRIPSTSFQGKNCLPLLIPVGLALNRPKGTIFPALRSAMAFDRRMGIIFTKRDIPRSSIFLIRLVKINVLPSTNRTVYVETVPVYPPRKESHLKQLR